MLKRGNVCFFKDYDEAWNFHAKNKGSKMTTTSENDIEFINGRYSYKVILKN